MTGRGVETYAHLSRFTIKGSLSTLIGWFDYQKQAFQGIRPRDLQWTKLGSWNGVKDRFMISQTRGGLRHLNMFCLCECVKGAPHGENMLQMQARRSAGNLPDWPGPLIYISLFPLFSLKPKSNRHARRRWRDTSLRPTPGVSLSSHRLWASRSPCIHIRVQRSLSLVFCPARNFAHSSLICIMWHHLTRPTNPSASPSDLPDNLPTNVLGSQTPAEAMPFMGMLRNPKLAHSRWQQWPGAPAPAAGTPFPLCLTILYASYSYYLLRIE